MSNSIKNTPQQNSMNNETSISGSEHQFEKSIQNASKNTSLNEQKRVLEQVLLTGRLAFELAAQKSPQDLYAFAQKVEYITGQKISQQGDNQEISRDMIADVFINFLQGKIK